MWYMYVYQHRRRCGSALVSLSRTHFPLPTNVRRRLYALLFFSSTFCLCPTNNSFLSLIFTLRLSFINFEKMAKPQISFEFSKHSHFCWRHFKWGLWTIRLFKSTVDRIGLTLVNAWVLFYYLNSFYGITVQRIQGMVSLWDFCRHFVLNCLIIGVNSHRFRSCFCLCTLPIICFVALLLWTHLGRSHGLLSPWTHTLTN